MLSVRFCPFSLPSPTGDRAEVVRHAERAGRRCHRPDHAPVQIVICGCGQTAVAVIVFARCLRRPLAAVRLGALRGHQATFAA